MELLFSMPWSCALDVVDAYPDGLPTPPVGHVLGATKQSIQQEEGKPHVRDALERIREIYRELLDARTRSDTGQWSMWGG